MVQRTTAEDKAEQAEATKAEATVNADGARKAEPDVNGAAAERAEAAVNGVEAAKAEAAGDHAKKDGTDGKGEAEGEAEAVNEEEAKQFDKEAALEAADEGAIILTRSTKVSSKNREAEEACDPAEQEKLLSDKNGDVKKVRVCVQKQSLCGRPSIY